MLAWQGYPECGDKRPLRTAPGDAATDIHAARGTRRRKGCRACFSPKRSHCIAALLSRCSLRISLGAPYRTPLHCALHRLSRSRAALHRTSLLYRIFNPGGPGFSVGSWSGENGRVKSVRVLERHETATRSGGFLVYGVRAVECDCAAIVAASAISVGQIPLAIFRTQCSIAERAHSSPLRNPSRHSRGPIRPPMYLIHLEGVIPAAEHPSR